MRNLPILFLSVSIAFCSCGRPAEKTSTITPAATQTENCPAYFYFYNQEKVPLKIHPQVILVGFKPEVKTEERFKLLKQFPEFENMAAEQGSDAIPFNVIKLKLKTTCSETLDLLKKLAEKPEIQFANPAFNAPRQVGNEYLWIGLTSEILVTVKSADQLTDLKKLLTETNTRLADTLGETTLLVAADKNSKMNALELANYFHEKSFAINAEPNFYLATKPDPKTGNPTH